MYERFTDQARRVLARTHNYVATEHLLLGILTERNGVAAKVLLSLRADLSRVRERVLQVVTGKVRPSGGAIEQSAPTFASGEVSVPVLRPGNIVFDTPEPERLATFWAALTGYVPRALFVPYTGLRDPSGVGPNLTFQRTAVTMPPATGSRCHIDLYVADPEEATIRAEALGARLVRSVAEGDVHWAVLTDPDGNEFCLVAAVGKDRR